MRADGPFHLRFILQPTVAAFIGIRDGLRFAREGRPFLLWGGPRDPAERRAQLLASWQAIAKVLVLAVLLDTAFQIIALQWFYPLETVAVVVAVAIVPYLLLRGLFNALMCPWLGPKLPDSNDAPTKP